MRAAIASGELQRIIDEHATSVVIKSAPVNVEASLRDNSESIDAPVPAPAPAPKPRSNDDDDDDAALSGLDVFLIVFFVLLFVVVSVMARAGVLPSPRRRRRAAILRPKPSPRRHLLDGVASTYNLPRTVNGTGYTGLSRFCATSS